MRHHGGGSGNAHRETSVPLVSAFPGHRSVCVLLDLQRERTNHHQLPSLIDGGCGRMDGFTDWWLAPVPGCRPVRTLCIAGHGRYSVILVLEQDLAPNESGLSVLATPGGF